MTCHLYNLAQWRELNPVKEPLTEPNFNCTIIELKFARLRVPQLAKGIVKLSKILKAMAKEGIQPHDEDYYFDVTKRREGIVKELLRRGFDEVSLVALVKSFQSTTGVK